MWRHHLRTALRALRRDRSLAVLGGLSLAVAVAACVLIALFVREELSYDRAVPNAERIAVLGMEQTFRGELSRGPSTVEALTPALMAGAPDVEAATTTYGHSVDRKVRVLDRPGLELGALFADSLFFDVFAYSFLHGDPETALDAPDGAVVTASTARRLFGSEMALGQTIDLAISEDTLTATVRGVIVDLPQPTSVSFEAVVSLRGWFTANPYVSTGWGGNNYTSYALRRADAAPGALQASLDRVRPYDEIRFLDIPLLDFHLSDVSYAGEGFGGDAQFLRLFGGVAVLILVLGATNYVNLSTARGARRAQEVGVRKALGSGRGALMRQFLTESVVLVTLAAFVGVGLAALAMPWFNAAFLRTLTLGALDAPFLLALAVGTLVIGVAAGLYPAIYLSRFAPDRVLRGTVSAGDRGGAFLTRTWVRRALVVSQFGAAVLLLVGTVAMGRQLDYALSAPLGFEPESVAVVPVTDAQLQRQPGVLKDAFLRSPAVEAVSGAGAYPTNYWHTTTGRVDPDQPERSVSWKAVTADPDYARVLGLDVVAGRWPSADRPDDLARGVVVNRAFVRTLGWASPDAAIGREVDGSRTPGVVLGVVEDFHFTSFREPIEPVLMAPDRADETRIERGEPSPIYYTALVRFAEGRESEGLADLEARYAEVAPGAAFSPILLSEAVEELYAADTRLAEIFGVFASLAILIACLGLSGLAAYTAERRTKEIGVRRVLGASVSQVVALLSREYVALAVAGAAAATPLGVILVRRWLETFAYRAPLGVGALALTVALALGLALLTVGLLAARAASADPTHSLRSE